MFCQNCGASIAEGVKFCPDCGARQDLAAASAPAQNLCPFCGTELMPDSVFCDNCGKQINGASQANAPEERDTRACSHAWMLCGLPQRPRSTPRASPISVSLY